MAFPTHPCDVDMRSRPTRERVKTRSQTNTHLNNVEMGLLCMGVRVTVRKGNRSRCWLPAVSIGRKERLLSIVYSVSARGCQTDIYNEQMGWKDHPEIQFFQDIWPVVHGTYSTFLTMEDELATPGTTAEKIQVLCEHISDFRTMKTWIRLPPTKVPIVIRESQMSVLAENERVRRIPQGEMVLLLAAVADEPQFATQFFRAGP
ncbi:hypothetical protein EDB19DRAFT_2027594 [Suillus lakei]|nr:hypothetical protein EDB19DRAFT_2027594 [Suillus lakei]